MSSLGIGLNPEQIEFAFSQGSQAESLSRDEKLRSGIERLLVHEKFRVVNDIRREINGYKPLDQWYVKGVESSQNAWQAQFEGFESFESFNCLRLTPRHGIPLYVNGRHIMSQVVFMTPNNGWLTILDRPNSEGFENPIHGSIQSFTVRGLDDLLDSVEVDIVHPYGVDRYAPDGETFVFKLACALDDLLRRVLEKRRESVATIEWAVGRATKQNVRFTGFDNLSSDRDYAIQEGLF